MGDDEGGEGTDPDGSTAVPASERKLDVAGEFSGATAERAVRYTHPGSILEGWVWKRSRYLMRWRRRWIVLLPDQFMSFRKRGNPKPTELISAGVTLNCYSADTEVMQRHCFCLQTTKGARRKRRYYLVCDDEQQKENWIKAVTGALCPVRA